MKVKYKGHPSWQHVLKYLKDHLTSLVKVIIVKVQSSNLWFQWYIKGKTILCTNNFLKQVVYEAVNTTIV